MNELFLRFLKSHNGCVRDFSVLVNLPSNNSRGFKVEMLQWEHFKTENEGYCSFLSLASFKHLAIQQEIN